MRGCLDTVARRPDFLFLHHRRFHELPISAQSLENHGFSLLRVGDAAFGQEAFAGGFEFPQGTGRPSQVAVLDPLALLQLRVPEIDGVDVRGCDSGS